MKNFLALAAIVAASVATTANAASLSVTKFGTGATSAYAVYLAGGADNGTFNAINFVATATPPDQFQNPQTTGNANGLPRPAGDAATFRNRYLDRDPAEGDGGKGYTFVAPITTGPSVSFDVANLGGVIDTSGDAGGRLFLANFLMPTGRGTAVVTLFNALGAQVGPILTANIGVPEPATMAMAGMAVVGLVAASRRRQA